MPNAFTRYEGSMYSNSPTTGNWEDLVSRDPNADADTHLRTLSPAARRERAGTRWVPPDHIADRFETQVVPFFAATLAFAPVERQAPL